MRYFKLTIAYDGTDYHGWQIQSGKPTIQGEIVGILRRLTQENVVLHGAGRTDAGVHALGQVGSFRTQSRLSAGEFQHALNALLPPAIRIVGADETGPDFNARWSARGKTYRYRLYRGRIVPPPLWRYVLHYRNWCAVPTTKNWFSPFVGGAFCATWCERWSGHCSMWGEESSRLSISIICMSFATAPNLGQQCRPKVS